MSSESIVQNMISQLGQSQADRSPPELAPEFFQVDPRSEADLLAEARKQAALMRFYDNRPDKASGNWADFIPAPAPGSSDAELLARSEGDVPPHLGLLGSFFALYREPQALLNAFTARHMDFQYRRALGFTARAAQPDHAHLGLELKKGAAAIAITPDQAFTGGKDATGVELIYKPVRDVVINHGKVSALHSVHRGERTLHFAPVANSADGLGAALDAAQPKWSGFGDDTLPAAPVGFALASPVLRMQEGKRHVTLELTLGGVDATRHTADNFKQSLEAHLTGPKGWLGPFPVDASVQGNLLTVTFELGPSDAAVVDYKTDLHAMAFSAQAPVVQLLLKPDTALGYTDLDTLSLSVARVRVDVSGVQNLVLENDFGSLNPKKAFQPFGPQPVVGSRFMVGCEEALSKHVTALSVNLTWQALPPNLVLYYNHYSNKNQLSNGVTGQLVFSDRTGQEHKSKQDILLRDSAGVTHLSPTAPAVEPEHGGNRYERRDRRLFGLLSGGSIVSRLLGQRQRLHFPMLNRPVVPPPAVRNGFITVALEDDFLHADYRRESVYHAIHQDKVTLNEPWTPTAQGISLNYSAESDAIDMSLTGEAGETSFTNPDVQFFHVGCFGQAREHSFLREQLDYVSQKTVPLLPQYPDDGELLIGVSGVAAGDSLSLLLQVAEGSADPELATPTVSWSVLADNHWRALTPQELALDTTNHLLTSGIVALTLPRETSTEHTAMPNGLVWLRAAIHSGSAAACQLIEIANNAVEVAFHDQGNDPAHLNSTLPAGSIAKLKAPQSAIKRIAQPYAGFGGRPVEDDAALTRRAAERLRHRNRCITPWDYERMLLEAFPSVHKVKCIPHASESSWLAPGHVMLIAIPDLRNQNAVDPLAPKVDLDTLTRMREFAQQHVGMQVALHVKNPRYQRVRLDFKVRFHTGFAFNFYRNELEQALIRALSPWAFDSGDGNTRQIEFGGRLYRSVLLDVVEELPYVDFVTDFRMGVVPEDGSAFADVSELAPQTPDAIFVSDAHHIIAEADAFPALPAAPQS
ncbi:baseplate J/gp47 family protein [Viridibacterium curvum]|uniref:Baseplate protein J-like domain-containing protein n=1 Tax=Viridibacterium curvum TaxID=1101404 RepID=A0ABP9QUP4_9RHOO